MAVGMALIYRANRVVNFAQAELGTVPTSFAAAFIIFWGWPYLLGFAAGLVMSIVAGVVIEFALIRRFRNSPRLVVTVATLGITQLLVVIGILIPRWWGRNLASERIAPPVDWKLTIGQVVLNANHLIALIVAPLVMMAVAWFLARSRYGVAIRASAERGDRAAMLGIPVGRLNTLVWAIAATMSFVALVPSQRDHRSAGRLRGRAAGVAAGARRTGDRPPRTAADDRCSPPSPSACWSPVCASTPTRRQPRTRSWRSVMFVVLLVQPVSRSRRDNEAGSTWRGAEEVRPLEHRRSPDIRRCALARVDAGHRQESSSCSARRWCSASATSSRRRRSSRSRSSDCRWWCSPVGPVRSRSVRWRSSASVPRSARPAHRDGTSTSPSVC